MKKVIFGLMVALALNGCETISCNCEYVTYEKRGSGSWRETYRSTWDASCGSETLSQSQFTSSNGSVIFSRTEIECR